MPSSASTSSSNVKFGIYHFPTQESIDPIELARAAESAGLDSLWLPDHSHIPTPATLSPSVAERVEALPREYWRTLDQLITLAAISSVTSTLQLGTAITLVPQRDPLWLAKEVATLDVLSGGRVALGIGYGWLAKELAHHGVRFSERRAVFAEHVLAMKALWTLDEAEFHGEFVDFDASWAWPKPIQRPHPPLLMGAEPGPDVLHWMATHCQGWIPPNTATIDRAIVADIRAHVADAGRDADEFTICRFGVLADPGAIEDLVAIGVDHISFTVDCVDRDTALRQLDAYVAAVQTFRR